MMTFSQYCLLIAIIYNVSSIDDKKFKGFMSWIWLIASLFFWVIEK